MQYFGRHIPNFAKILGPIRRLLQKDVPFCWTAEHDQALEKLKDLLLQNATLAYPDFNEEFVFICDASKNPVGHVLAQTQGGVFRPLMFGCCGLRKFEQSGSVSHIELIALSDAIKSYHPFLSNGSKFLVSTDHCSLK
jgi:hypothetical protein